MMKKLEITDTVDLCKRFMEEGIALALLEHQLTPEQEDFWLEHIEKCESCMAIMADVLYADSEMKSLSLILNKDCSLKQDIDTQTDEQQTEKSEYFSLDNIELETELKEDLFNGDSELLLARGTLITPTILEILQSRGISEVRFRETPSPNESEPVESSEDENKGGDSGDVMEDIASRVGELEKTSDVFSDEASSDETTVGVSKDFSEGFFFAGETTEEPSFNSRDYVSLIEKVSHREAIRQETKLLALNTLESALKALQQGASVDLEPVRDVAKDVVSEMLKDESKTLSLMDLFLFNSKVYSHSLNTLVIFTALAKVLDFEKEDILVAGEAVLMHDIGRILQTADGDDDPNAYRNHPMAGYRHLMKHGGFNEKMLTLVLNHHERYDGKGFPRGIIGEKLGIVDQIMIVANAYDLAITDNLHNVKRDFHAAAQMIYQSPNVLVSSEITNAFLNVFGIYPPGSYIKLRSGEEGIVREANYLRPFQPHVTLLMDNKGNEMPEPLDIDLRELENTSIERSLDIAPLLENQNR